MIEYVTKNNLHEVLPLIADYQDFYQMSDICPQRNATFCSQFSEHSQLGSQFAYPKSQQLIGFASVYFSYATTMATKLAILNDLYIIPQQGHQGCGLQLIGHCQQFSLDKKAIRLQWLTAQDNHVAQSLYDTLPAKALGTFTVSVLNKKVEHKINHVLSLVHQALVALAGL